MNELLTICRDWCSGYPAYTRTFTLGFLCLLREHMSLDDTSHNGDDFTEFMTGLHCDSYADQACDIMHDTWSQYGNCSYDELYDQCMRNELFQTCYTVYRLWNSRLSTKEALASWKDSCLATMEGLDLGEE